MTLIAIIFPMIGLILYGKTIKEFKKKHFLIAACIALFQLSFVAYNMFTMEKPPLF